MSKVWVACIIEQDKNYSIFEKTDLLEEIGYYCYCFGISESENLYKSLSIIGGLKTANVFTTKKRAREFVEKCNTDFRKNGTYLYDATF